MPIAPATSSATNSRLVAAAYLSYSTTHGFARTRASNEIDWLEVKWPQPSGSSERFKESAIDRYIKIVEGEGQWK